MDNLVSHDHKLTYVSVPKVACTTLKWWFSELLHLENKIKRLSRYSMETEPDLIIHDLLPKVAPKLNKLKIHKVNNLASSGYFTFALTRNPFKRIFSAWQSKILLADYLQIEPYINCDFFDSPFETIQDLKLSFEAFLDHLSKNEYPVIPNPHWAAQFDIIRPDLINYSSLYKLEDKNTFRRDLSAHLGQNYSDPFDRKIYNKSLLPFNTDFFTKKSIDIIQSIYKDDFAIFGYATELPASEATISIEQLDMAANAIHMLRGRHLRMREINKAHLEKPFGLKIRSVINRTLYKVRHNALWRTTQP